MLRRLLLFAKLPVLGNVKTRLIPPLAPKQALELYRAFLSDQSSFLQSFRDVAEVELYLDGPGEREAPSGLGAEGLRVTEQSPGDLGQRMLRAFQRSWQEGARSTVVIGADAPTLPRRHVLEAFRILESGAPAVIGPAEDGGYVLLGLRQPLAELFRDIPWGTARVLRTTRLRALAGGVELAELASWYDVDEARDLGRLQLELALPGGLERAPATARLLGNGSV